MSSKAQAVSSAGKKNEQHPTDLRQLLIETGLKVLAEDGLEKLTLRRVAALAGVSHAAPAYHFRGLSELLGCICAVGFEELAKAMEEARQAASQTPRGKLVAVCEGYVAFALANRGLIQLMFSNRKGVVDEAPLKPASERSYAILRDACAPFTPVGSDPDSTETMIWSLVHGFAFLQAGQRFANPYRATPVPRVADVLPVLDLRDTQS